MWVVCSKIGSSCRSVPSRRDILPLGRSPFASDFSICSVHLETHLRESFRQTFFIFLFHFFLFAASCWPFLLNSLRRCCLYSALVSSDTVRPFLNRFVFFGTVALIVSLISCVSAEYSAPSFELGLFTPTHGALVADVAVVTAFLSRVSCLFWILIFRSLSNLCHDWLFIALKFGVSNLAALFVHQCHMALTKPWSNLRTKRCSEGPHFTLTFLIIDRQRFDTQI